MHLIPYKMASQSSKNLANSLGIKRIKLEDSKFKPNKQTVLNWGNSKIPANILAKCEVINRDISKAVNKLFFFKEVEGMSWCIPFTSDKQKAIEWVRDGCSVVCRTILNGHSGAGIVIASKEEEIVDAPLYTLYIKKKDEYRIHVAYGEVFFVQKKSRKMDVPDEQVNWQVRNHDNGFIFAHQNVERNELVEKAAVEAIKQLGLDFGAADVIFNTKGNKAYVLEINTSPGLEGATLEAYTKVFQKFL